MSNRVNRALANAYLQADKAASYRAYEEERQVAIKEWNQLVEDSKDAVNNYTEGRSFWETAGSVVGSAAGAAIGFVTGGPVGAAKGAAVGWNVGDDLAMVAYDIDGYHLDKAQDDNQLLRDFDFEFSSKARRYKHIREGKIDPFQERQQKALMQAEVELDKFDDTFDKGVAEILIDEGIDIAAGYATAMASYDLLTSNIDKAAQTAMGEFFMIDDLQTWGQALQSNWEIANPASASGGLDLYDWLQSTFTTGIDEDLENLQDSIIIPLDDYNSPEYDVADALG